MAKAEKKSPSKSASSKHADVAMDKVLIAKMIKDAQAAARKEDEAKDKALIAKMIKDALADMKVGKK